MILLLGGTSDANHIADLLKQEEIEFCLSVTSDYGAEMALRHQSVLHIGALSYKALEAFIVDNKITAIVDGTHPHAQVISEQVQKLSKQFSVPYLRYERPCQIGGETPDTTYVRSVEEAAQIAYEKGQRIFVTGSKHLKTYVELLAGKDLFARVIPSPAVMQAAVDSGIPMDHLIAMKGPFSEALNKAMFESLGIQVLITKESGQAGGFEEKCRGAMSAGVHTVVIQRPLIHYIESVHTFEDVMYWIKNEGRNK